MCPAKYEPHLSQKQGTELGDGDKKKKKKQRFLQLQRMTKFPI